MKEIYSRFHGDGVEFIGVSLDQSPKDGGLDALKKFVKERQVPWPQYYEGKGWEGEFHNAWGIGEIPTVFVIDPTGPSLFDRSPRQARDHPARADQCPSTRAFVRTCIDFRAQSPGR